MLLVVIGCVLRLDAQPPGMSSLLDKVTAAAAGIQQGSYQLHDSINVVMMKGDSTTYKTLTRCYFRQLPHDTLTGYLLSALVEAGEDRVYDGRQLFRLNNNSRELEVVNIHQYPDQVKRLVHDQATFPFFKFMARHMRDNAFDSTGRPRLYVAGEEPVNGERCYRIQEVAHHAPGDGDSYAYYYVSAVTFLPVRWYVKLVSGVGQGRVVQHFTYTMLHLQRQNPPDSVFTRRVLLAYNKEKQYNPATAGHDNRLLPVGREAPGWQLPEINGGDLALGDLRGKLVVLDFWFKSCVPCQQQMADIEQLLKKYREDQVVFVGVNMLDDLTRDKLAQLLRDRNLSMHNVWKGDSITAAYHVYSAPALFVIDRDGKIIYTLDGYSRTLAADLAKLLDAKL